MSEQWTDLGDPEPPVDAPPMETEEDGPLPVPADAVWPAHPPEGSAGEQGDGTQDVEPVPDTDAAGRPFAGPDEPG